MFKLKFMEGSFVPRMKGLALSLFLALSLSACSLPPILQKPKIKIVDAKTAVNVDENLAPVEVTSTFAAGTSKVFCWFQWRSTKPNMEIVAKWHYITDDIHILDYAFTLPRKEGSGSVALAMPEGKKLPSGFYKVDLTAGKQLLTSIVFKLN